MAFGILYAWENESACKILLLELKGKGSFG
jgi:hypothetical protein